MPDDEHGRKHTTFREQQNRAEGHVLSKGATMYEPVRAPRFEVGNRVVALVPTNPHRGKEGIVVEVIESAGDKVYRYVVRFDDGSTATLFSFELQLL